MSKPAAQPGRDLASLLADAADLAYFRVDADRNVVEVSAAMERLTGFTAADAIGRSCLWLHRCEECLKGCGVFDQGIVTDKRLSLYRADGSRVEVDKSGRVVRDESGRITGAVEVVHPVDEGAASARSPEPAEALLIRAALERARYNRTAAARALGISRTSLWRKMKQYGI